MQSLDYAVDRLHKSAARIVEDRRAGLDRSVERLFALSPREILARGYTICTDAATGSLLRRTDEAVAAGTIAVTFADGSVTSEVKEKRDAEK
jgi:exodeoxyribonuclease VII large subunit